MGTLKRCFVGLKWRVTYWFTRPHMLDMRCPANDYSGGHMDADYHILFACFNRFAQFMEKERPLDLFTFTYDKTARHLGSELTALYKWWTVDRPNELRTLGIVEQEGKDQQMLERLIAIRGWLWT